MHTNGTRPRTNSELTEYQKRIESMDNVILCVAEAEHMIKAIGRDMVRELPQTEKRVTRRRRGKPPWADPRNTFKK